MYVHTYILYIGTYYTVHVAMWLSGNADPGGSLRGMIYIYYIILRTLDR